MKWDEFYKKYENNIIICNFSGDHKKQIKEEFEIAYDKSPLLREMIDNWVINEKSHSP